MLVIRNDALLPDEEKGKGVEFRANAKMGEGMWVC
jgi:hypothetical protein